MSRFSIAVYGDSGPVLIPAALDVRPVTWSGVDIGGMWDAEIDVFGALDELAGLTAWLGSRLEIINEAGAAVWWGDIEAIGITADGVRRGVSLATLATRMQVRYARGAAGGGATSADTDWADSTAAQAAYGVRELRVSAEREMNDTEAETYRSVVLTALSEPAYTLESDGGETSARIYCTGYWQRTKRTYYRQAWGLVEHTVSGEAVPLGLGFTSASVAFVARTDQVHSIAGYFKNFASGMRVTISGASSANNGTWLLNGGGDTRAAIAYTSTGVTFSPNDDMADANGGLGFLAVGDAFTLAGTNDNNGTHLLDKAGAAAIEVSGSYHGGNVVSESAGDSAVFSRGNLIGIGGSLTNEHTGNTVTVTVWGQRHYQPFLLPAAGDWTAARIEIRMRREGDPADNITVDLVADSSGAPGSVLESVTISGSAIPRTMGWVVFALTNTTVLDSDSGYGIVVKRSGANSPTDYYEIDMDKDATYAGGALRQWDGATWQTPDPALDMAFRVLGAEDTATQATFAVLAQNWATGTDAPASGVTSPQYRDGELRTFDEVAALLAGGTSTGAPMGVKVQRSMAVDIAARPDRSVARWVLRGATLYDLYGKPAEDGYLPAGEWVHLGDAATLGPWARLSPVFVERAEYSAAGGLRIEPAGTTDIFDTGVVQG